MHTKPIWIEHTTVLGVQAVHATVMNYQRKRMKPVRATSHISNPMMTISSIYRRCHASLTRFIDEHIT